MTLFKSLGFFLLTCASLSLTACSGGSGAPGAGGAGGAGACANPQATCGASCSACGCPACVEAFAPCSVPGECAEGTLCLSNIPCANSEGCPSLCLPHPTAACDATPCGPDQACIPWGEEGSLCFIPAAKGEKCDDDEPLSCAAGLYCTSFGNVCEAKVPAGGACEDTASCPTGFYCSVPGNKCAATGTLGQSCNTFESCAEGLYCNLGDSAGNPTCLERADSGQPCHQAINSCKNKKGCSFPAGLPCKIDQDCSNPTDSCCASGNGTVCKPYTSACKQPEGVCP